MTRAEQLHSSAAASTRAASFLYMVRPLNFQHGPAVVVGQLQRDLAAIQAAIDERVGDGILNGLADRAAQLTRTVFGGAFGYDVRPARAACSAA